MRALNYFKLSEHARRTSLRLVQNSRCHIAEERLSAQKGKVLTGRLEPSEVPT